MVTPGDMPKERPVLCIGMTGFSPQQRAALATVVAKPNGSWPSWRVGPFWEADAWWVNGARISVLPDGNLRVLAGMPSEQALNLKLQEVNRPVAFSTPLATNEFEAICTFNPESEPGVHKVLARFEGWLQPLLFKTALGALIVERGTTLRGGIYHLRQKATLLAVLDFRYGKAAIMPTARPVDLKDASWDKRPSTAHDMPESFLPCTPAQLVWTYARHTGRDLLPVRYRTEVVYYRHVPRVPMGWLRDSMLRLLSALSSEPGDFKNLCHRTGTAETLLASDLACLYYAGAVTTTPMKAAGSTFPKPSDLSPHSTLPDFDSTHSNYTQPPVDADRTAPAMLYQRPVAVSGD